MCQIRNGRWDPCENHPPMGSMLNEGVDPWPEGWDAHDEPSEDFRSQFGALELSQHYGWDRS